MTVTFQLSLNDWKAFLRATKGLPTHMLGLIPLMLLIQQVFLAINDQTLRHDFAVRGWAALTLKFWIFVASLVMCVVMYHLAILNTRMRFQKSSFAVGPTTIVVDEEGIAGATSKKREAFSWIIIDRIIETKAHFFVLNAPLSAFIIPKRAFVSPSQCADFGASLQRQWAQSHPDATPFALAK